MQIAVVDGQGGGIGKAIIEKLKTAFENEFEIIALGTNAMATSVMIKAGANQGASGENAIIVTAPKVSFILGSIGIIAANSMLGELTPAMARAVAESPAKKVLLPLNRCNVYVAGIANIPLLHYIDEAIVLIKSLKGEKEDV